MSGWVARIPGRESVWLAGPHGPLRTEFGDRLAGDIGLLDDGLVELDDAAVDTLTRLGYGQDGRVTWDDGPALWFGQDRYQLTPH